MTTLIEKVRTFITAYLYDDDDGKTAELLRELDGMVIVREDVIKFLLGEDLLRGCFFEEKPPNEKGNYWWRKYLH